MSHVLIVAASFYKDLAASLSEGARVALEAEGATFEEITVPGALEIPAAIRYAMEGGAFDGYVALGCVIRGETTHYATVCEESARGLTWLMMEYKAAIGNGILTVENDAQAWERADPKRGNKGGQAAQAALSLIRLKARFGVAGR
jgi:6,7-dimethyl-8-ribityllumazine synthase